MMAHKPLPVLAAASLILLTTPALAQTTGTTPPDPPAAPPTYAAPPSYAPPSYAPAQPPVIVVVPDAPPPTPMLPPAYVPPSAQELPPPEEPAPRRAKVRYSPGMMYTGVALVALGGAGVICGGMVVAVGSVQSLAGRHTPADVGLGVMTAGLVTAAIGVPLLVIGASRKRPTTFAWTGEPGPRGWVWRF